MKLVIGLHHHKHGVDVHAFDTEDFEGEFGESDFVDYLEKEDEVVEGEYGEWVEVIGINSENIKKVKK